MAHKKNMILFISPVEPRAHGTGMERRCWNHVQALRELGTLDIIVTARPGILSKGTHIEEWQAACRTGLIIPLRADIPFFRTKRLGAELLGQILNTSLRNHRPDEDLSTPRFQDMVGRRYSHVFCFRSRSHLMWDQLRKAWQLKAARIVVDFDDIESSAIRRALPFRAHAMGREATYAERIRAWYIERLERAVMRRTDDVIVCSHIDRKTLMSLKGRRADIHVVPNTVATNIATLGLPNPAEPFTILFVGTMNYPPNQDAAKFFAHDILPLLRRATSHKFRCFFVGFAPPEDVKAMDNIAEITVTGGVDSVADYYAKADVAIAPIRFGGGTRIKILEAMAYGRPVVSTSLGAEGIEAHDGTDICIADSPESFAKALVKLMDNSDLRAKIALGGRKLIDSRYSLNAAKAAMSSIIKV